MQPVLHVEGLWVDYFTRGRRLRVVQDVSFAIERGEMLGLAGESGSGKSTVALAVARLLRPENAAVGGMVRLNGTDFLALVGEGLRQTRWKSVALVSQSAMNALNPVINIFRQFDDMLTAHGYTDAVQNRHRAAELLDLVDLPEQVLNRFPHQLSGGMKQRVVIALALALHPDLIIMDEPTTALDVIVEREILSKVKTLQRQLGFSVLFITHDLDLLLRLTDRVAIMYAGQLVETGPVGHFSRSLHPYSRALVQSFPSLHQHASDRRRGIPGAPPDLSHPPAGCRFHPRCVFVADVCQTAPAWEAVSEDPLIAVRCSRWKEIRDEFVSTVD